MKRKRYLYYTRLGLNDKGLKSGRTIYSNAKNSKVGHLLTSASSQLPVGTGPTTYWLGHATQ